jgi:hypothetical protein
MGRDAAQTEDGRYRLLVEAVTDYAMWVLILIVPHNLGLRASSRGGIGVRQIGPQRNSGSFVYCQLRLWNIGANATPVKSQERKPTKRVPVSTGGYGGMCQDRDLLLGKSGPSLLP